MTASSRRYWCGLCLCAVLACAMLIEPVQRIIKRTAIEYAFGGHVSVANVHVHQSQELLEFNQLQSAQFDEATSVNVTVDRGLVKFDMPALVDKRFVSSRVKLQGVKIELAALPLTKPTLTAVNPWQAAFEEVMVAFQWDHLREDCQALLKADNVLTELDQRMRGWLLRSQQIMFHSDQLTRAIQAHSNPLRHQTEIRNQLTQLEQLRLEQANLQNQFSSVNAILASQLKEIQSTGEKDIAVMRAKCDGQAASLGALAAEQLVSEWTKQLLSRQLQLSQAVATLLPADSPANPYNVDVRSEKAGSSLISLSGIEVDGFLSDSLQRFPFTATGQYATRPKVGYHLGRSSAWSILFQADSFANQLELESVNTDDSWKVKSRVCECNPNSSSPSDFSLVGAHRTIPTEAAVFELAAAISEHRLSGKARMNLGKYRAFIRLPCASNADMAATELTAVSATAALNDHWIEFTLTGSLCEAQLKLDSDLPAEFSNVMGNSMLKRLETHCSESESKFRVTLNAKVEELSKRIGLVAQNGQQTVVKQSEALRAMHQELDQFLQFRDGFEYARLPTKTGENR